MSETETPQLPPDPANNPEERALINRFLSTLALLSGILTGGGIFLLTDWTLGPVVRIAVAVCLISLCCALRGMDLHRPGLASSVSQWMWFRASAAVLLLALTIALVGIILR
jgi:hypothetical protein